MYYAPAATQHLLLVQNVGSSLLSLASTLLQPVRPTDQVDGRGACFLLLNRQLHPPRDRAVYAQLRRLLENGGVRVFHLHGPAPKRFPIVLPNTPVTALRRPEELDALFGEGATRVDAPPSPPSPIVEMAPPVIETAPSVPEETVPEETVPSEESAPAADPSEPTAPTWAVTDAAVWSSIDWDALTATSLPSMETLRKWGAAVTPPVLSNAKGRIASQLLVVRSVLGEVP